MTIKHPILEYVTWQEVRHRVAEINPRLFAIIDKIASKKDCRLIKACYEYGDTILNHGTLQLPSAQGLKPLQTAYFSAEICEDLNYSHIPTGLILTKCNEVFANRNDHIVPLNFFKPGELFGVFELMDELLKLDNSKPIWYFTAGARSTLMLPKVTDVNKNKRLQREFDITPGAASDLASHWQIFAKIAHHNPEPWQNEILFFTKQWFAELYADGHWFEFYQYLLQTYWQQQQIYRDTINFEMVWQAFIATITERSLKPHPYLLEVVKQLILLASGATTGFAPAVDDSALPLTWIQQTYVDRYGLAEYVPTIMQPAKVTHRQGAVYYSLLYPTVSGRLNKSTNIAIVDEERLLNQLLDALQTTLSEVSTDIKNPFDTMDFELFHIDADPHHAIQSTKTLEMLDNRFSHLAAKTSLSLEPSFTGPFLRGCVRILEKPVGKTSKNG